MRLAFERLPTPLRGLTWLLALDGTIHVMRWIADWYQARPASWGKLALAWLPLIAALRLFRGRRSGIDWLLWYGAASLMAPTVLWWRTGRPPDGREAVGLLVVMAISAYGVWCRQRLPWQASGSFGDWMTNPDYRDTMARWFADRDRLVAADRRHPPDPDEVVRDLLDDGNEAMARHRVRALPEHFGTAVLRALDDRRFLGDAKALARLVELLPESLHQRATTKLVTCLAKLHGADRDQALRILAANGDTALLPMFLTELAGERASAIAKGLVTAVAAGRICSDVKQAITPALRRRIGDESCPTDLVVALAALEPGLPQELAQAAIDDPTSERPLRQLAALGDARVPLPSEALLTIWRRHRDGQQWFWCFRLLPFITAPDAELYELLDRLPAHFDVPATPPTSASADQKEGKYARLVHARTLEVLVERHGKAMEPRIRAAVDLHLCDISDDAANLLLRLHGIADWGMRSAAPTTQTQRHLRSLSRADAYACNGGIVHAFDSLSADDMAVLEPALRDIAPPEVRDLWLAALREVSPTPLPTDVRARQQLLMSRYSDTHERLDELSKHYYRCKWMLDVAMAKYAIAHQDELVRRDGGGDRQ